MSIPHIQTVAAPFDIKETWKDKPGTLSNAMRPGAGFSFTYDGKSIGPEFAADWRRASADEATSGITRSALIHTSGLLVTREMRVMPEFGAVEYRVIFKNTSRKVLPAVSGIHALNIAFGEGALDANCFVSSGGGLADGFLPPRTFAIRKSYLSSVSEYPVVIELGTEGGRSSNKDLPFFFLHNSQKHEGMFAAIGWSGQWAAVAFLDQATKTLSLKGKIPDVEIALEPGEEIQGATVLVGLYQGEVADGSNRLRRLIRDVYTPELAGAKFLPIATYDTWFGLGLKFDESVLRKLADGASAIGQEYFLLDAGWYTGTEGDLDFSPGLGNWYDVDRGKLPNGLGPIAEYVRSKGLKFGLWFEPERVASGSHLALEHPDWVLWEHGKEPESWWRDLYPTFFKKRYGLLDYGRLEVQRWVQTLLDRYIRDYDVEYIRYDFNLDPLPYWEANDKPNRRGITQLRHIQGFYSIIDWVREQHPGTVLEGCASGGRRIDLETARRFHTSWISDYTVDPSIIRYHLFGINHFMPGNYNYVQYTLPSPTQKDFEPDDLGFQSLFGGAFGTGGRIDLWPDEMKQMARQHVETWKRLRRYLVEDYYPLSAQPGDTVSWSGWQFQDPNDQSGFVQTFRTNTADATHRFVIHKLEEQAHYRFSDVYGGEIIEVTGSTAMTEGIEVVQEPMSSRIFTYRKLSADRARLAAGVTRLR